jgi:hypothetical protein
MQAAEIKMAYCANFSTSALEWPILVFYNKVFVKLFV